MYSSIMVLPYSLALMQTLPGPATIVSKGTKPATDDDMALPIYTNLELFKCVIDLRQEADKVQRLEQRR